MSITLADIVTEHVQSFPLNEVDWLYRSELQISPPYCGGKRIVGSAYNAFFYGCLIIYAIALPAAAVAVPNPSSTVTSAANASYVLSSNKRDGKAPDFRLALSCFSSFFTENEEDVKVNSGIIE